MPSFHPIPYEKVRTVEKAGSILIYIDAVKDLDAALNAICEANPPENPADEERVLDLCPYFALIWPAGRGLAQFIAERKSWFKGKFCIEVGSGLALPSLVAAKLGANVMTTDFHPDVESWVMENASANSVLLKYQRWDWTAKDPAPFEKADFVLASDVLYEKRHPADLVQALVRLVKPDGKILLSYRGRGYLNDALDALKEAGFEYQVHSFSVEESSHRPEERLEQKRVVFVYECSAKA